MIMSMGHWRRILDREVPLSLVYTRFMVAVVYVRCLFEWEKLLLMIHTLCEMRMKKQD